MTSRRRAAIGTSEPIACSSTRSAGHSFGHFRNDDGDAMTSLGGIRRSLPLLLMISSALVGQSCARTAPQDRLNVPCVTRLQLPFYPPIAQSARVSASMTAAIVLSSSGSIQSIALEDVSGPRPDSDERIFRPEIERALKASQFAPTCGGKPVRLAFAFQIDRHPPKSVWFEFPNRFEIAAAEAPLIDTGRQEPAPVR